MIERLASAPGRTTLGDLLISGWRRTALHQGAALALIIAVFALVSFLFWPTSSLWVDETASYYFATLPWPEFWENLWLAEANMSLYYLMLKCYLMLGFDSEFALRLPSAIFAVLAAALIYRFVRRERSASEALVVSLVIVINPMFVKFSWEARSYTMLLFFAALTIPLFWRAVETTAMRWFVLFGVTAGLSLYAHIFMLLLYAAAGFWLLGSLTDAERRIALLKGGVVGYALMILVAAPMLAFFMLHTQDADNVAWIKASGFEVIPGFFIDLVAGKYTYNLDVLRLTKISLLTIVLLLMYAAFLYWGYSGRNADRQLAQARTSRYRMLLLVLSLLPVVMLATAARLKPLYVDRYLIYVLIAFVPLVVSLLAMLPLRFSAALLTLLIMLDIYGLRQQSTKPHWELKQLYQDLAEGCNPGDAILFANPSVITTYNYYRDRVEGLADCQLQQQPVEVTRYNYYRRVRIDEVQWPAPESDQTLWTVFSSVGSPLHSITGLLYEKSRQEYGVELTVRTDYPNNTSLLALRSAEE